MTMIRRSATPPSPLAGCSVIHHDGRPGIVRDIDVTGQVQVDFGDAVELVPVELLDMAPPRVMGVFTRSGAKRRGKASRRDRKVRWSTTLVRNWEDFDASRPTGGGHHGGTPKEEAAGHAWGKAWGKGDVSALVGKAMAQATAREAAREAAEKTASEGPPQASTKSFSPAETAERQALADRFTKEGNEYGRGEDFAKGFANARMDAGDQHMTASQAIALKEAHEAAAEGMPAGPHQDERYGNASGYKNHALFGSERSIVIASDTETRNWQEWDASRPNTGAGWGHQNTADREKESAGAKAATAKTMAEHEAERQASKAAATETARKGTPKTSRGAPSGGTSKIAHNAKDDAERAALKDRFTKEAHDINDHGGKKGYLVGGNRHARFTKGYVNARMHAHDEKMAPEKAHDLKDAYHRIGDRTEAGHPQLPNPNQAERYGAAMGYKAHAIAWGDAQDWHDDGSGKEHVVSPGDDGSQHTKGIQPFDAAKHEVVKMKDIKLGDMVAQYNGQHGVLPGVKRDVSRADSPTFGKVTEITHINNNSVHKLALDNGHVLGGGSATKYTRLKSAVAVKPSVTDHTPQVTYPHPINVEDIKAGDKIIGGPPGHSYKNEVTVARVTHITASPSFGPSHMLHIKGLDDSGLTPPALKSGVQFTKTGEEGVSRVEPEPTPKVEPSVTPEVHEGVSLKGPGWNHEAAQSVKEGISAFHRTFPEAPRVNKVEVVPDQVSLGNKSNTAITVSPMLMDKDAMKARGWDAVGVKGTETPGGTVVHEYGHVLDSQLGTLHPEQFTKLHDYLNEPITYKVGGEDVTAPRHAAGDLSSPSAYASQNRYEYVAEALADHVLNGEKAADTSKHIASIFHEAYGPKTGEEPEPTIKPTKTTSPESVAAGHEAHYAAGKAAGIAHGKTMWESGKGEKEIRALASNKYYKQAREGFKSGDAAKHAHNLGFAHGLNETVGKKGTQVRPPEPTIEPPKPDVEPPKPPNPDAHLPMGGVDNHTPGENFTYYHGTRTDGSLAQIGGDKGKGWDEHMFVSHDPAVARLYAGNDGQVHKVEMQPDTKVVRLESNDAEWQRLSKGAGPGMLDQAKQIVANAHKEGADVVEFHRPHDFIGHVIVNRDKIVGAAPKPNVEPEPEPVPPKIEPSDTTRTPADSSIYMKGSPKYLAYNKAHAATTEELAQSRTTPERANELAAIHTSNANAVGPTIERAQHLGVAHAYADFAKTAQPGKVEPKPPEPEPEPVKPPEPEPTVYKSINDGPKGGFQVGDKVMHPSPFNTTEGDKLYHVTHTTPNRDGTTDLRLNEQEDGRGRSFIVNVGTSKPEPVSAHIPEPGENGATPAEVAEHADAYQEGLRHGYGSALNEIGRGRGGQLPDSISGYQNRYLDNKDHDRHGFAADYLGRAHGTQAATADLENATKESKAPSIVPSEFASAYESAKGSGYGHTNSGLILGEEASSHMQNINDKLRSASISLERGDSYNAAIDLGVAHGQAAALRDAPVHHSPVATSIHRRTAPYRAMYDLTHAVLSKKSDEEAKKSLAEVNARASDGRVVTPALAGEVGAHLDRLNGGNKHAPTGARQIPVTPEDIIEGKTTAASLLMRQPSFQARAFPSSLNEAMDYHREGHATPGAAAIAKMEKRLSGAYLGGDYKGRLVKAAAESHTPEEFEEKRPPSNEDVYGSSVSQRTLDDRQMVVRDIKRHMEGAMKQESTKPDATAANDFMDKLATSVAAGTPTPEAPTLSRSYGKPSQRPALGGDAATFSPEHVAALKGEMEWSVGNEHNGISELRGLTPTDLARHAVVMRKGDEISARIDARPEVQAAMKKVDELNAKVEEKPLLSIKDGEARGMTDDERHAHNEEHNLTRNARGFAVEDAAKVLAQATKEELAKEREFGGGTAEHPLWGPKPLVEATREQLGNYPTEWIANSTKASDTSPLAVKTSTARAHYAKNVMFSGGRVSRNASAKLSDKLGIARDHAEIRGNVKDKTVLVHELGHRMEHVNEGLGTLEKAHVEVRNPGKPLLTLPGYRSSEVGKINKFVNPYAGKIYRNQDFHEAFTMGMQSLLGPDGSVNSSMGGRLVGLNGATPDPGLRSFTLGALALHAREERQHLEAQVKETGGKIVGTEDSMGIQSTPTIAKSTT